MSTLSTPSNEEELEAARDVLRAVISSNRVTPRVSKILPPTSVGTQTEGVPLEGLVRAAGMALANFAAEIKSLERKLESQNREILDEIKKIR